MMRATKGLAAGLAMLWPAAALSNPVLDAGFGDNMVLQAGQPLTVSGRTQPGVKVAARLGKTGSGAVADGSGVFSITLPAQSGSAAPVTLTISDETGTTTYNNILIGNVFLCAGQSNMELSVTRALDAENQLRLAPDDSIRLLMVPKTTAPLPQVQFGGPVTWRPATSTSVADFSAACFYMAKALRRKDPATPIGLIHSNWGGSAARAWLDPEGVLALHGQAALDQLGLYARDPYAAAQAFVPQWFDWWRAKDSGREPWKNSALLDWKPTPKFTLWNEWTGTGLDTNPRANVWLRTVVTLTPEQAAGEGSLAIGAIDDMDLTFVNGHPVGYTFGWGVERTYRVPPAHLKAGKNEILIAANNMWDTGGFFAGPERLAFTAANGDRVPLGTNWEYAATAVTDVPPRAPWDANAGLGVMHNAMIAPLGRMTLAGVAWYQGESDAGQPAYDQKLATLFAGWRRQFGPQTRMLVVQLADWGERRAAPGESGWAQLRDEQRLAVVADSNAALVTAIDIGEPTDIHPANKNDLGKRLAEAFNGRALPMPEGAVRNGDMVTVSFTGIEGALQAQGGPYPLGVELCEAGMETCRFALASLAGSRMVIPVPQGMAPTRVRYAWADAPVVNLVDGGGMPIPGFGLDIAP
ncbi:sialate O-acetylesterase [Porphyrobacter sp. TH134]|uniref:sialate O-acetylesterase n=1 Tax=Porphyrobacter sp. TH134 TaxID=2067450 RepID=UPI000C79FC55|nr:sialate O-acetylesterase [Porphyrobacter sp. TH134]PLK24559.1 sialate O-acetylesterase [Porphyrobacter sp. TH134]